jgi:hypothetical protein
MPPSRNFERKRLIFATITVGYAGLR